MPTSSCAHRPLPARFLRRFAAFTAVTSVMCAIAAVGVASAQTTPTPAASWQFTPVAAPPPPTGTAPGPFAVPLGPVGQISFWAPNRGLLITGGTEGQNNVPNTGVVPAGVWAYNGADWHELSDVCGGADGRIAWAGPDEFWTIADQRPGEYEGSVAPYLTSLSLCHFYDGQVIASYAMPTGQADSYQTMDAASCDGPDDCWFGGQDTTGPDPGVFELHWDGTNLTQTQEPDDYPVDDSTIYQGQIFESVRLIPQGTQASSPPAGTAVFHEIEGDSFDDVFSNSQSQGVVVPWYAPDTEPDGIAGLALSTDSGTAQESLLGGSTSPCLASNGCPQLWGAASAQGTVDPGVPTIVRHTGTGWTQVAPEPEPTDAADDSSYTCPGDPDDSLLLIDQLMDCEQATFYRYDPVGSIVTGSAAPNGAYTGTPDGTIAAIPGTDEAWVSLYPSDAAAQMALIDPSGDVVAFAAATDPGNSAAPGQPANGYSGPQWQQAFTEAGQSTTGLAGPGTAVGAAGAVDCPAENDCWMATSNGWLYQYTNGATPLPVDTDPNFAGIITVRPADAATETVYGDVPPIDDSGTNDTPTYNSPTGTAKTRGGKSTTIVVRLTKVKAKLVHGHDLQLSFNLNVRARIQIIAERHGKVVAKSARKVLARGRHTLTLTLSRKRWPNHLKVDAKAVTGKSSSKKTTKK